MTGPAREDLPREVRDQLDGARGAVPPVDLVDGVMVEVRGARQVRVWPAWVRGSVMGLGAAAALLLVAFLANGPFGGNRTPSGTEAPAAVPSGGQLVTVVEGDFRLELWTDRKTYTTDDPISIAATLTYIGPEASVTLYHADPMLTFLLNEQAGTRSMGGGVDDVCQQTVARRNEAITIPYTKSAAWTPDDPNAAFYQAWMRDPVLRLPAGTWTVVVLGEASVNTCGGRDVSLGQKLDISVTLPPGATPSATPTASPTPVEPELTGTKISSGQDMRIVGWSPDGRWLAVHAGSGSSSGVDLIRIFDAKGHEVGSLGGVDASWMSPDVLAVLRYGEGGPATGTVILHHVSSGLDEGVPGHFSGVEGSGTGRLALTIADPSGETTTFKLLGSDAVYPGYPLTPGAWDPTGRWLAIREVSGIAGPGDPYPLALLDAQTGALVETPYKVGATSVFFSQDGHMLTDVVDPTGTGTPVGAAALVDLVAPRAAAVLLQGYGSGPALPDGRWLVGRPELEAAVWNPATGEIVKIARGQVGVSASGVVAVVRDGYGGQTGGLELNGTAAGVEAIGIAGSGWYGPVWSPAGDRLVYALGQNAGATDLYLLAVP
jgi:hypothetical protein